MILGYSDLHFAPGGTMTTMGYSSRLLEIIETCNWICEQILVLKPKLVVNLGDNSQNNNYVDLAALDAMGRSIWKIDQTCRAVGSDHIILIGNHDMRDEAGSISVGSIFPYAKVVDDVMTWKVGTSRLAFISFKRNQADFDRALTEVMKSQPDMLFIHQDLQGVVMNPVKISDVGYDPSKFTAKQIFNGHYHLPQTYVYGDDPHHPECTLHLVGSTMFHNFSDDTIGEERGMVWITEDEVKRVPNPVTPIYHSMSIASDAEIGDWVFKDTSVAKYGKRLRLRVIGTEEQILFCKKQGIFERECEWVRYVLRSRQFKQDDSKTDVDFNFVPTDMVGSYVKNADTTLNRDDLVNFGVKLLRGELE